MPKVFDITWEEPTKSAECNETRETEFRAASAEFVSSTLAKTEERARQRAANAEAEAP